MYFTTSKKQPHKFAKYWRIFKILYPTDSSVNL